VSYYSPIISPGKDKTVEILPSISVNYALFALNLHFSDKAEMSVSFKRAILMNVKIQTNLIKFSN
jgi:hypothetical protein